MANEPRIGGNLAQATWTTDGSTAVTGEGGASAPPAINVVEFTGWSFPFSRDIEDTTPLAQDSPRFDLTMRRPDIIECYGLITASSSGSAPAGAPRLPYVHTDGVVSTAKLKLIVDKNNPTRESYIGDAHYIGVVQRPIGRGGRKQQAVYRFIYTGPITQVSNAVSTTIR